MDSCRVNTVSQTDIPALKKLWNRVFGDDEKIIDEFFNSVFDKETTVAVYDGDALASMLYMLPVTAVGGGNRQKAYYIYAVATAEEYRGRGLAKAALAYAEKLAVQNGAVGTILRPATQDLFKYYKNLGYITDSYIQAENYTPKPIEADFTVQDISADEYKFLRDKYLENTETYIEFGKEYISFAINQCVHYGGKAVKLTINDRQYGAFCYKIKDKLKIAELCADDAAYNSVVDALCKAFEANTAEVNKKPVYGEHFWEYLTPYCMTKYLLPVRDRALFPMSVRISQNNHDVNPFYMNLTLE